MSALLLSNFDFELPPALIADRPLPIRSHSKLMSLRHDNTPIRHQHFYDIIDLIEPGDLLVFNDTKVIPARLYGEKITGGRIEVLIERILNPHTALVQLRVSKPPRIGDALIFANNIRLQVTNRRQQFYELTYARNLLEVIHKLGQMPIPHYMHRASDEEDIARYQTVYAKHDGSVAAPTAGFHFDEALLARLSAKGVQMAFVTLHIGAGTFSPIRVENITEHQMHAEYFALDAEACAKMMATKAQGNRVIAVGTTTLRALESACCHDDGGVIKPFAGDTQIFIYPGFKFRCADVLITNFHLPRSSLLLLVCAFGGRERILHSYQEAIRQSYRFYSYGDAMWIERRESQANL